MLPTRPSEVEGLFAALPAEDSGSSPEPRGQQPSLSLSPCLCDFAPSERRAELPVVGAVGMGC